MKKDTTPKSLRSGKASSGKPAKDRPLTPKQKAFVQELLDNPKQSATQAVLKTYGKPDKPVTYLSARNIASDNLTKPNIMTKLAQYNDMVESAILQTISDWKDHDKPRQREIAMNQAQFVHDKIHGKATQKVETRSEQVTISIDLTGVDTTSPGETTE